MRECNEYLGLNLYYSCLTLTVSKCSSSAVKVQYSKTAASL